jgi:hypothetical protein
MPRQRDLPWERAQGKTLVELLALEAGRFKARNCIWFVGRLSSGNPDLDAAAWLVADEMMRGRCGAAQRTYELWRGRATGGPALSQSEHDMVEAFVEPSIGLPNDAMPRHRDHLEGAVAEYIWFLVARDRAEEHRSLRHLEKPSLLATEPGGDGLAIYRLAEDGSLVFRLWEVKKSTGADGLSRVVTRACSQLASRGRRYFAKYASQAEYLADAELLALFGDLGERWITWHPSAGAGVSISTSESKTPAKAFSQMHRLLPRLSGGDQLEGLITGIGDFATFAIQVRDVLWSGL